MSAGPRAGDCHLLQASCKSDKWQQQLVVMKRVSQTRRSQEHHTNQAKDAAPHTCTCIHGVDRQCMCQYMQAWDMLEAMVTPAPHNTTGVSVCLPALHCRCLTSRAQPAPRWPCLVLPSAAWSCFPSPRATRWAASGWALLLAMHRHLPPLRLSR